MNLLENSPIKNTIFSYEAIFLFSSFIGLKQQFKKAGTGHVYKKKRKKKRKKLNAKTEIKGGKLYD